MSLSISVIIPVYNEENTICATLKALITARPDEVIVVDGASIDRTAEIASALARVVTSPRGRAVQMNEAPGRRKEMSSCFCTRTHVSDRMR